MPPCASSLGDSPCHIVNNTDCLPQAEGGYGPPDSADCGLDTARDVPGEIRTHGPQIRKQGTLRLSGYIQGSTS